MRSLLYILAIALVIAWVVGAFVVKVVGGLIHVLLVLALVALVLGFIRRGASD